MEKDIVAKDSSARAREQDPASAFCYTRKRLRPRGDQVGRRSHRRRTARSVKPGNRVAKPKIQRAKG